MQISYYMEIDSDRGKSSSKLNSHLGLMSIWNPIGGITFLAVFIIAISHSQALFFGLKKKKKKNRWHFDLRKQSSTKFVHFAWGGFKLEMFFDKAYKEEKWDSKEIKKNETTTTGQKK